MGLLTLLPTKKAIDDYVPVTSKRGPGYFDELPEAIRDKAVRISVLEASLPRVKSTPEQFYNNRHEDRRSGCCKTNVVESKQGKLDMEHLAMDIFE